MEKFDAIQNKWHFKKCHQISLALTIPGVSQNKDFLAVASFPPPCPHCLSMPLLSSVSSYKGPFCVGSFSALPGHKIFQINIRCFSNWAYLTQSY